MHTIIIRDKFDAAHFLPNHQGKCKSVHGHTWHVEVELQYAEVAENGMCIDFAEAKKRIRPYLHDHSFLNEKMEIVPTAEHIAEELFYELVTQEKLPVSSVTIWESENAGVRCHFN